MPSAAQSDVAKRGQRRAFVREKLDHARTANQVGKLAAGGHSSPPVGSAVEYWTVGKLCSEIRVDFE